MLQSTQKPMTSTKSPSPRFNDPPYNKVPDMMNNILTQTNYVNSKMYGTEPQHNEPSIQ